MRRLNVVLVGPGQQENIALGYLAASVEAAGHRAYMVRYGTSRDLQKSVCAILELRPDLVGFGMAFQYAIDDYLELARALRARGFSGHLTCGGHVPTFCYEQLLDDLPELDTVVRHEGEGTLVELVERLARGEPLGGVAGLVWRNGGSIAVEPVRPPAADLDALPAPKRKKEPFVVAGVPIAFALTSRGCMGECAYCSIRAFGQDQGGRRLRFRRPEAVAHELADLYHRRGVRVVLLQDDIFLLPSAEKTVDRVRAITRELRARQVEQMLFWIKGRPESITAEVVEAVREMGAAHVFLGIENASVQRLRYLGREHSPEDNERAIALCLKGGVRPSFVLMLFDPDCALSDVEANVDFAEKHLGIPWNLCRTEVYSGTQLLSRLQAQGRLEGDYRTYGYTMADTAAEILFRILRVSFHQRAFAFDSLLNQLITLSFARQAHLELLPGPATDAVSREVDRIVGEVYADTVVELRRAIEFAKTARMDDATGIRDFAVQAALAANERDHLWSTRVEKLMARLTARGAKILRPAEFTRLVRASSRFEGSSLLFDEE